MVLRVANNKYTLEDVMGCEFEYSPIFTHGSLLQFPVHLIKRINLFFC